MIGKSVIRKEDDRLLRGKGLFVDDVQRPNMLHAVFLRSVHPHARIRGINRDAILAQSGIVAVLTANDWPELTHILPELLEPGSLANPYCDYNRTPPHSVMSNVVKFVGEAFAVVVGETLSAAMDGAEVADVDYEVLPPIVRWADSFQQRCGVHDGYDSVVAHLKHEIGDIDAVFAGADIVAEERLEMQSVKAMALECRGAVAEWDNSTNSLNIWSTTQIHYVVRSCVANALDLPLDDVRVIARDIGGGFGLKGALHPEDLIVPIVAYKLRRAVKWIETRSEHMTSCNHSGEQVHDVRVAAKKDGTLLGLDVKIYKDVGAYNHFEMVVPTNTVNHLPLQYRVPNIRVEAWSISTHKTPVSPYRGAGRPEATFTMDRALDLVAQKTGLDVLAVRQRNIIPHSAMPYETGLTYRDGIRIQYDTADYPRMLQKAIDQLDYEGWRERQRQGRQSGRLIGIGLSSSMEAGGVGPCEGATVRIEEDGHVRVLTGVNSQGQSHETTFAQICAEKLGIRLEDVTVLGGDTALIPFGFGTAASRVAVNTGNAVSKAALEVRRKVLKLASKVFGCANEAVDVVDGVAINLNDPSMTLSLSKMAKLAHRHPVMRELGGPGLSATEFFYPRTITWSAAFHGVVVDVDKETASVKILKYVIAHDCGVPLNPLVVDGQIQGGFAQGLGIALGEALIYDDFGQVVSGSLMDYAVPRATDVPDLKLAHFIFPTVENPLGIRSVGEAGPISPPAAIISAVEDAFEGRFRLRQLPLRGEAVLRMCGG